MKNNLTLLVLLFLSTVGHTQMVAHYPLDGNGLDVAPNNFNTTVNGAIPTGDRFGNANGALYLDGIDDYLEIANQEELNFGTFDFAGFYISE